MLARLVEAQTRAQGRAEPLFRFTFEGQTSNLRIDSLHSNAFAGKPGGGIISTWSPAARGEGGGGAGFFPKLLLDRVWPLVLVQPQPSSHPNSLLRAGMRLQTSTRSQTRSFSMQKGKIWRSDKPPTWKHVCTRACPVCVCVQ